MDRSCNEPFGTCLGVAGQPAFQSTRRRTAIDTLGGLAVTAGIVLIIAVVGWQTMPIPARIEPGLLRRGMLHGLLFAVFLGVFGSAVALYLIGRAFASFTGW